MKVLTINCGSSSIKFELFEMRTGTTLASGLSERIGGSAGRQSYRLSQCDGSCEEMIETAACTTHREGLQRIANWLASSGAIRDASELVGIGHRVAHGGAELTGPTMINEQVLAVIQRLTVLAPLHNGANLDGIEMAMAAWPATPQVAVFDTAFHHTLPRHAHQYAVPADLARAHGIRRYGFHGTSHQYVAAAAAQLLDRPPSDVNLIVLHLGNGASATAVRGGQSIDTSMGMTPLEGLVMGTRCGDIDAGVVLFLAQAARLSVAEVDTLLNQHSGLRGICGAGDMREVLRRASDGDESATLAMEIYCYRVKKYIGAYSAVLPGVDALVFTAGIGEHSAEIRRQACSHLDHLGIRLNEEKNLAERQDSRAIHADDSQVQVLVIPTNEELEIAKQTLQCVKRGQERLQ